MVIGIDGNEANTNELVGVGRYTNELIKRLFQTKTFDYIKDLTFKIYLKKRPLPDFPRQSPNWLYLVFGSSPLWVQKSLLSRLWREKIYQQRLDVFWSPSHYAPIPCPIPSVISIMDMSYIHYPDLFLKKDLWQLRLWTFLSAKFAKKIFTISNFSKKAIIDYYHFRDDKVVVTYPGYDENKFNIQSINQQTPGKNEGIRRIKRKYGINGDYLLFVGTLQPRKNLIRLIEAFVRLPGKKINLVLAGKKGWLYREILNKIKDRNLGNKIIVTDYISEDDLPDLYRGAKCFILPSLYEGFGLPVIEAMACGCPVVASNVSSLPEIVGDAGVLINPNDTQDIKLGISKIIYDDNLRNGLIEKGLKRVNLFSWNNCAEKTLEVLINVNK